MPRAARTPLVVALMLVASACGGDDSAARQDSREIAMRATDSLRFEPGAVTARAGERVTFVVSNPGTVDHEFVIGTADYLSQHAEAAAGESGGGHAGHGGEADGVGIDVPAGKTARVTFEMPEDAPSFACFVDRHDKAGMTGTVSYA